MKVKDVMQNSVIFVKEDTSVKKLAHIAFSSGAFGFPVVDRKKKVVGIVTQEDIFLRLLGSKGKRIEAKALAVILEEPVQKIMVRNVMSISPDTDVVQASLLMYKNSFAQLPVVNEKKELVGIVTHGSMFRNVIEKEIPQLEENDFASFIEDNYDQMIDWEKRFDFDFPSLFRIFKRDKVEKVLDVGVWTGEYTIGLAREGVDVVGVDNNPLMVEIASGKRAKLPEDVKKNVSFKLTDYKDLNKIFPDASFDAAISMGNVLPYLPVESVDLIKSMKKIVRKNGVIVLQLLNIERILTTKKKFLYFKTASDSHKDKELYIEFYNKKSDGILTQHIISFVRDRERWVFRGINSIEIKYVKHTDVEEMFKKAGITDLTISGNKTEEEEEYGPMSLVKPFDPATSDWMTVIARL